MSAVEQDKPLTAIAEYNATAAALADLEHRYKGVVFDVATREGMATAIKGRAELRGYRVALEKKLDGDPTAWTVADGKLYVNVNKDVEKKYREDVTGNNKKAEANWPQLRGKTPKSLN